MVSPIFGVLILEMFKLTFVFFNVKNGLAVLGLLTIDGLIDLWFIEHGGGLILFLYFPVGPETEGICRDKTTNS